MLFHSYIFLFAFLPVTWGVFILLKRLGRGRDALVWLTFASFFFYGWWNPPFVLLVIFSILVNFYTGLALANPQTQRRKALLWFGLLFNLIPLAYFKYVGFLAEIWGELSSTPPLKIDPFLPLAISFYTFQKIGYLVDAYKRRRAETSLVDFSLFVMFFPQLIAGPIVRHDEIIPQIKRSATENIRPIMVAVGVSLLVLGLAKKVVLADHLGGYFRTAWPLIDAGSQLGSFESWLVMSACAMQIYFDYSGYADMAAGLGLMFGVRMPLNFFSPYKATSPVDFWRRWNMTLMRFLRDYVYIPLGGSRHGEVRKYACSFATMVVCGIWHGAGWNYVVWGATVATILMFNNLWLKTPAAAWTGAPRLRRIGGRAITFAAYVLPLAIFMCPQVSDGLQLVHSMLAGGLVLPISFQALLGGAAPLLTALGFSFGAAPAYQGLDMLGWIGFGFAVLYLCPNAEQMFARYRPTLNMLPRAVLRADRTRIEWRPSPAMATGLGLLAAFALTFVYETREFFYFQF